MLRNCISNNAKKREKQKPRKAKLGFAVFAKRKYVYLSSIGDGGCLLTAVFERLWKRDEKARIVLNICRDQTRIYLIKGRHSHPGPLLTIAMITIFYLCLKVILQSRLSALLISETADQIKLKRGD